MSPLGKKIVVYAMAWVLLAMVASQVYDNVRGKGMPSRTGANPTPAPSVEADAGIQRLADLQTCISADPENLECITQLGRLYYTSGQWPQAQVVYERAVELSPHDVELLKQLAGTYIYQEMFEEAVTTLEQASTLAPDAPEIHLLLGLSLSKLNPPKLDWALDEWRTVIRLAPESPWAKQAQEFIDGALN